MLFINKRKKLRSSRKHVTGHKMSHTSLNDTTFHQRPLLSCFFKSSLLFFGTEIIFRVLFLSMVFSN